MDDIVSGTRHCEPELPEVYQTVPEMCRIRSRKSSMKQKGKVQGMGLGEE